MVSNCFGYLDHMTKMVFTPIYDKKKLQNLSSPETKSRYIEAWDVT